jgi:putative endonuclease
MAKKYFAYIATNKSNTLYTGITDDLTRRMEEHKNKRNVGFTQKYNINKLVYYQEFDNPQEAIGAEKRIKGWTRKKKIELIKSINQTFKNLLESF